MIKVTTIFMVILLVLFSESLFAGDPVVVDTTGHDCEWHYYVHNSLGSRIAVDDSGDVHVVYNKSFIAEPDSGFVLMYANVTKGIKDTIPPQEPEMTIKPSRAFIGGGRGKAPLFIYYGISTYCFHWGDMPLQAIAEVDSTGKVVPCGRWHFGYRDPNRYYYQPISMEVDPVNGIAHCIFTNVGGQDIAYSNTDGTNFGEIYQMYFVDPDNDVPGKYIRNATKGADLAITNDGSTVAVGGLHPWCNIDITFGSFSGEIWPDDFQTALDNRTFIFLFDTTDAATGDNFTNHDQAKPATDLQLAYDDDDVLHVAYQAAWFDHYLDTLGNKRFKARNDEGTDKWGNWSWMTTYYYLAGDTNAVYYGTGHPKPQIRYWNSNMDVLATSIDAHIKIAESVYPLAGEEYQWWSNANIDSGVGLWGNRANCIIEDLDLVINHNPVGEEPKAVIVYEEMGSSPTEEGSVPNTAYFGYYKDIKITTTSDFVSWTKPYNLTATEDMDEGEVSVHPDIIDNKIHLIYNVDDLPMSDYFLRWSPLHEDKYVYGVNGAATIRKYPNVSIMYQEVDLAITDIKENNYLPGKFNLAQNYPNPFNPTTLINYTVPSGNVKIEIYNVLGQKVETLVDRYLTAGSYNTVWDGTNGAGNLVSTGIYFYKLKSKAGIKVKKMLFQK